MRTKARPQAGAGGTVSGSSPVGVGLEEKMKALPESPGVYIFKDSRGRPLYVGKALSLRNRVRSYFQTPSSLTPKVRAMVEKVRDLDWLVTSSETEALILENNLIKEYSPWYNVRLRDDKSFPYVKVTLAEDYPRVYATRRHDADGSRYFGPYTDAQALYDTLSFIRRVFPVRSCKRATPGKHADGKAAGGAQRGGAGEQSRPAARPCLNYFIKRCMGPCTGEVSREAYRDVIDQVMMFLEGRRDALSKSIRRQMEEASARLDFERAARLRDRLGDIERVTQKQKIVSGVKDDRDVFAIARGLPGACAMVLIVRGGKVVDSSRFVLERTEGMTDQEVLGAFLDQYYARTESVPREVVTQYDVADRRGLEEWLSSRRGQGVRVVHPVKGPRRELVEMARQNAEQVLAQLAASEDRARQKAGEGLAQLAKHLGLPAPPGRIEAFDISNIQGRQAVGSMVVFEGGVPSRGHYRRFRIRGIEGPDDPRMMGQLVGRRLARLSATQAQDAEEADRFGRRPDLIMVDGGKPQLSAALAAAHERGWGHVPIVALAKQFELLFLPGRREPLELPRGSEALFLIQRIRDEAHRFAVDYHRRLRARAALLSSLEDIPGVGKKRIAALYSRFKSLAQLKAATVEEITSVPGMTRKVAEAVHRAVGVGEAPTHATNAVEGKGG